MSGPYVVGEGLGAAPDTTLRPFIGAPVHYRSYGTPHGEYKPECRAAIITQLGGWITFDGEDPSDVWVDGDVQYRALKQRWEPLACMLKIENPTGTFNNLVRYDVPPTGAGWTPGTWHWGNGAC